MTDRSLATGGTCSLGRWGTVELSQKLWLGLACQEPPLSAATSNSRRASRYCNCQCYPSGPRLMRWKPSWSKRVKCELPVIDPGTGKRIPRLRLNRLSSGLAPRHFVISRFSSLPNLAPRSPFVPSVGPTRWKIC